MKRDILDNFKQRVQENNLGLYGILVKQKDEKVEYRWRSDDKVNIYSASKAVTALAIGILEGEGKLHLSDKMIDFFPEYLSVAAPHTEKITVRNLLHMQSGKLAFFGEFRSKKQDNVKAFMEHPVSAEPGETFCYSNGCTYMLSRIVEKITGQTLRDFLVPRLFDVLNIENPQWFSCHHGHTLGATGLFLTLEELSRIGEVFLNEGMYNNIQIVSSTFIRKCFTDAIATANPDASPNGKAYGYQIWLGQVPGTYRLDGKYGQYSIIFPQQNATVTITAHEETKSQDIVSAVYSDILPYL